MNDRREIMQRIVEWCYGSGGIHHLAFVVARGAPDPDDIIAFARARLAHYKCPTAVTYVDELPRNPSGKVLKRELRQPYWPG